MDYLVYIEYSAENLQFYLWYRSYVERFNASTEEERALSPEWIPEIKEALNLLDDTEKEEKRKIRRNTTAVQEYDTNEVIVFGDEQEVGSPSTRNLSVLDHATPSVLGRATPSISLAPSIPTVAEVTSQAGLKWQPCKLTLSLLVI